MDDKFAEIEIETNQNRSAAGDAALRFFSPVSPPEPIKPRIIDPIREKFYEMRKLASVRPFARNDSELFYRQAKFMEDFTDNYEGNARFNMYYPFYQNMGYEYLRTYFTWRSKVRNDDIQPTSLSYIFLYIYELLSGIGTDDPTDGLNRLMVIWNTFSTEYSVIAKYLPKWIKDYFIFYELPHNFSDFVKENKMQKHYSLSLLFNENTRDKLELWNGISGYDVTNSKYYKEDNEQLMSDCFEVVLHEIQEFCKKRNTRFEDLLVYSVSRRSPWYPFKQALFCRQIKQNDREIIISEFEKYYCKNNQWTASLPIYYSTQKDFVGYVIKKTEACLRLETKYKYKLVADMKSGKRPFRELQRPAAKRAELDKVIEKAVADFYKELNRTIVKVDHSNLKRIREEALETQEQLIVPEDASNTTSGHSEQSEESHPAQSPPSPRHCGFDPQSHATEEPLTLSFADGWKALKEALTDIERKALSLVLQDDTGNNSADIKAFADKNGIMLEVLADNINEKAADSIGDSILEIDDEIILYDEYRENIISICS